MAAGLPTTRRGAGGIAQVRIREHTGQRTVRDAVDVLFRGQCGADGAVIELLGQGTEQQTAVDGVIGVDLGQHLQQVLLGGVGGEQILLDCHADLSAAGHDAALVGEIILPFAHAHHGQRGDDALCLELFAQGSVCFVHGGNHRCAF